MTILLYRQKNTMFSSDIIRVIVSFTTSLNLRLVCKAFAEHKYHITYKFTTILDIIKIIKTFELHTLVIEGEIIQPNKNNTIPYCTYIITEQINYDLSAFIRINISLENDKNTTKIILDSLKKCEINIDKSPNDLPVISSRLVTNTSMKVLNNIIKMPIITTFLSLKCSYAKINILPILDPSLHPIVKSGRQYKLYIMHVLSRYYKMLITYTCKK